MFSGYISVKITTGTEAVIILSTVHISIILAYICLFYSTIATLVKMLKSNNTIRLMIASLTTAEFTILMHVIVTRHEIR